MTAVNLTKLFRAVIVGFRSKRKPETEKYETYKNWLVLTVNMILLADCGHRLHLKKFSYDPSK